MNDVPVDSFVSNKARPSLAFLVVTNRPQPRPVLAELLWGDKPDDVANANLRMALSNLRKLVGPCLHIRAATCLSSRDVATMWMCSSFRRG